MGTSVASTKSSLTVEDCDKQIKIYMKDDSELARERIDEWLETRFAIQSQLEARSKDI